MIYLKLKKLKELIWYFCQT